MERRPVDMLIGLALSAVLDGAPPSGPDLVGMPPASVRMGERRRTRPDGTAVSPSMRMTSHAIMMPWHDTPMPPNAAAPSAPAAPGPATQGDAPRHR